MKKILLFTLPAIILCTISYSSELPFGFTEKLIAQGLDPTDMVITSDGRIFITIKSGKVLVVKNDVLLTEPLLNIESLVDNFNERGLGHIALDPEFDSNGYFYLYYTVRGGNHNRVSRFKAIDNTGSAEEEMVLLDLDGLSANIHNGGEMAFGPDGKLYISTGDGGFSNNAQSTSSLLGKVLRINSDGSIPEDNPFYSADGGIYNAIWALGFRNPFSMDIQPATGRVFACDVGNGWKEEINDVQAGKNYGWPLVEGKRGNQSVPSNYMDPLYDYAHGDGPDQGCSIVGAAFYNPSVAQFPDEYIGKFFFGDYCNGYIKYIDPATGTVSDFITGISRPLTIHVAPDGSLYYLARAGIGGGTATDNTSTTQGTLWKVMYTGTGAPKISVSPQPALVSVGQSATFTVAATGKEPLNYQWQESGVTIAGAQDSTFTYSNAQLSDDGKQFRCIVMNDIGSDTSEYATLTVTAGTAPTPSLVLTLSSGESLYKGGDTLSFSGAATDVEDGELPASALTWKIDFHHDTHTHPALETTPGVSSGQFTIPQVGETSDNVWYRIYLTAMDSEGLTNTIHQEVFPLKTDITLETEPQGLQLMLDGQPVTAPYAFTSVVNIIRALEAPRVFNDGSKLYFYDQWTDPSLDRIFTFKAPDQPTTFRARFEEATIGNGAGLKGEYYNQDKGFEGDPDLIRLDSTIDFKWANLSPDEKINSDYFTVRWSGELLPLVSDTYYFHAVADDGVRVWMGDQLILDRWSNPESSESSAPVDLVAGEKYPIRIEYYETTGSASVQLKWSSTKVERQNIPYTQLFSDLIASNESVAAVGIKVYPTIVKDHINILSHSNKSMNWSMINSLAHTVKAGRVKGFTSIDVSDLPAGVYVLKLNHKVARFVKK